MNAILFDAVGYSRKNSPGAFPETDARQAWRLAIATQDHFIAIFKECARFTSRQLDRSVTMFHFQQASLRTLLGT
jgi:hypothetical protein